MTAITVDRTRSIGGSDCAAILGISPWRTPLDVWREKVLHEQDQIDTPATRAGTRFEPHILAAYRARLPESARVWTPEPTLLDGYRRCTVDAIASVDGWERVVEAKSTVMASEWGQEESDDVPLHYVVQGMWYADILGLDQIDFPALLWPRDMRDLLGLAPAEIVAACDLRVLTVAYSPSLAQMIRERVERFWRDHVQAEVPPPPVDLEDCKRLSRVTRGKVVPADDQMVRLLVERDQIKAEAEAIKERDDQNAFAIRQMLDDAEAGVAPNGLPLVTCKQVEKAAYTVKPQRYRELRLTKHWKELAQQ